jgi:methyl-accepting chemotaxis protein
MEQSSGIEQINRSISHLDEVNQQNSALVEENAATAKMLEQQSRDMTRRVDAFRIDGHSAGDPASPQAPAPERADGARPKPTGAVHSIGQMRLASASRRAS